MTSVATTPSSTMLPLSTSACAARNARGGSTLCIPHALAISSDKKPQAILCKERVQRTLCVPPQEPYYGTGLRSCILSTQHWAA